MKTFANNDFFAVALEILSEGETVELRVVGNSMYPLLRHGDAVQLEKPMKAPSRGDVVLFRHRGTYVLHRVVSREDDFLTMRGDGVCHFCETAHKDDVVALMTAYTKRKGKRRSVRSFAWRTSSGIWSALFPLRKYLLAFFRRIYPMTPA